MNSDMLASIPLFASLDKVQLEQLGQLLRPREYGANQTILWIGEPGEEMFIVQSGTVVVSAPGETQAEITLGVLRAGSFLGELSLLDGGPRTATARTTEPSVLLALDRRDFYAFLENHPKAAIHVLQVLSRRQRDMVDRCRGIRNVNEAVEEQTSRLQRLMDKVADFGASQWFLALNVVFLVAWISINWIAWRRMYPEKAMVLPDEPPTFFTLCFIIGFEAILLTMFVLTSQKRQAQRDHIRADLEYQVNLKAHHEVMQLHRKIDRLEAKVDAVTATAGRG
jgi:uncharacterized membrane protein